MDTAVEHEQRLDELQTLMDKASVNFRQREELRADPELGIELLEYALSRPKIRNPGAFVVARFRQRVRDRVAADDLHHPEPSSIEELESGLAFARSNGAPSAIVETIEAELDVARARAAIRELDAEE
jgi:hypothetical protein